MSIVLRGDRLACVKHVDGTTRIYLVDTKGHKKKIGYDDSFFVEIAFDERNSTVICQLIAECQGMNSIAKGQGLGGSFLFEVV